MDIGASFVAIGGWCAIISLSELANGEGHPHVDHHELRKQCHGAVLCGSDFASSPPKKHIFDMKRTDNSPQKFGKPLIFRPKD
jgi:hypothetical protein